MEASYLLWCDFTHVQDDNGRDKSYAKARDESSTASKLDQCLVEFGNFGMCQRILDSSGTFESQRLSFTGWIQREICTYVTRRPSAVDAV